MYKTKDPNMYQRTFTVSRSILERLAGIYSKVGQYRFRSSTGTTIRIPPFRSKSKNGPSHQLIYVDPTGQEHRVSGVFTGPARFDVPTTSGQKARFRIHRVGEDSIRIQEVKR